MKFTLSQIALSALAFAAVASCVTQEDVDALKLQAQEILAKNPDCHIPVLDTMSLEEQKEALEKYVKENSIATPPPPATSGVVGHLKNNWHWYTIGTVVVVGGGVGAFLYLRKPAEETDL